MWSGLSCCINFQGRPLPYSMAHSAFLSMGPNAFDMSINRSCAMLHFVFDFGLLRGRRRSTSLSYMMFGFSLQMYFPMVVILRYKYCYSDDPLFCYGRTLLRITAYDCFEWRQSLFILSGRAAVISSIPTDFICCSESMAVWISRLDISRSSREPFPPYCPSA